MILLRNKKPRILRLLDLYQRYIRTQQRVVDTWNNRTEAWDHKRNEYLLDRSDILWTRIYNIINAIEKRDKLYNELLFAVGQKYPNETRHQTALRYIREAEESKGEPVCNKE